MKLTLQIQHLTDAMGVIAQMVTTYISNEGKFVVASNIGNFNFLSSLHIFSYVSACGLVCTKFVLLISKPPPLVVR